VRRGWFRFRVVSLGMLREALCVSGFRILVASPLGGSSESPRWCVDSALGQLRQRIYIATAEVEHGRQRDSAPAVPECTEAEAMVCQTS
jgi:hypothetical protein